MCIDCLWKVFTSPWKFSPIFDVQLVRVVLQDFSILCCVHFTLYKPFRVCCRKAPPHHDAATTMLYDRDCVFDVRRLVSVKHSIYRSLMATKLNFCLLRPKDLLSVDLKACYMPVSIPSFMLFIAFSQSCFKCSFVFMVYCSYIQEHWFNSD